MILRTIAQVALQSMASIFYLLPIDRLGFHHVMMAVGIWPILLVTIGSIWRSGVAVTRDVEDGLYSKAAYIITKVYILLITFMYLYYFKV